MLTALVATDPSATGFTTLTPTSPAPSAQPPAATPESQTALTPVPAPTDQVDISPEGKKAAATAKDAKKSDSKATGGQNLSQEQQEEVASLQKRDREVRQHEQAHLSQAGPYAQGGPSFSYERGADGKNYAVGGEVSIDVSKEKTPEATISKMRVVQRAALAPVDPSSADRAIAAEAAVMEAQAQRELQSQSQASGQNVDTFA